jgi:hypothetical protein
VRAKRVAAAVIAACTAALAGGLLPNPWDGIAVVVVAALGTYYESEREGHGDSVI